MTTCCYLFDGSVCGKPSSTIRIIPLRTDLPGGDHLQVCLCHVHDQMVNVWMESQRIREAESR